MHRSSPAARLVVMRRVCRRVTAAIVLLASGPLVADEPGRIAVTIDDLPTVNLASDDAASRRRVTLDLLAAAADRRIPLTGFVNESQLYPGGQLDLERVDLLRLWLAAGFDLGNHSYSHPDLHRVSLAEFQADVLRGDIVITELLAELGREPRYFRHPYLHTGTDIATKRAVDEFLAASRYRVAPVTIDNSEWIFARAFMLAKRSGDAVLARRIGDDYVDYMLEIVEYYEEQSKRFFGRNISHVLLLHANELNSVYFGALADRIANRGYHFVSVDEALEDPAYESADTYTGPGGITWLHRWAITRDVDPSMFAGEPATPGYVLELTRLPEHGY